MSNPLTQLRVPPNSAYDERAVLGACLISTGAIPDVSTALAPEDFYGERHRVIFSAIVAMARRSVPPDVLTLGDELRASGQLETAGGLTYLNELLDAVPTAANALHYAENVKRYSTLRAIIGLATEAASEGYGEPGDVQEFLGRVQRAFASVEVTRGRGQVTMAEVAAEVADDIRASQSMGCASKSVPTGIPALDDHLGGLHPGQLILVAARPGTGKTVTMLHMAHTAARESQMWALVASLEMTPRELVYRALSSAAQLTTNALRGGRLTATQEARVISVLGELSRERMAFIADARTVSRVRAAARKRQMLTGLSAVYVDYIGLMKAERRAERKDLELGEVARDLKLLATEMAVPVVCLVQLNREVEKRDGGRPRMSDLRNSGELEEAADVVIGLHRDKVQTPRVLEVEVLKGRSAGETRVEVEFDPAHTRIVTDSRRASVSLDAPETWHDR